MRSSSHLSIPLRTPYATTASVCPPAGLGHRAGADPSPLLSLVQPHPTPRLDQRRLVGCGHPRIGESVQPVGGKAGAGIALEVSRPQQFLDQDTAFTPAGFHAYADRRCPHLHVWGGRPKICLRMCFNIPRASSLMSIPDHPEVWSSAHPPNILRRQGLSLCGYLRPRLFRPAFPVLFQ